MSDFLCKPTTKKCNDDNCTWHIVGTYIYSKNKEHEILARSISLSNSSYIRHYDVLHPTLQITKLTLHLP